MSLMSEQKFLELLKGSKQEKWLIEGLEESKQQGMSFEEIIKTKKKDFEDIIYEIYEFIKSEKCRNTLMKLQELLLKAELVERPPPTIRAYNFLMTLQELVQELQNLQEEVERAPPEKIKEFIIKVGKEFDQYS